MSLIKSTHYMEEAARHTLHHICGFSLDDLECRDKPDLQSKNGKFGIEVVQDVYANERERQRFVETIWGKPYEEIAPKKVQRLERGGGSLRTKDGIINGASLGETSSDPSHLIKTVKKKIDLINKGGYKEFKRYGLYVFVETTFIDENFKSFVQQVIDVVAEYQKDRTIRFDMLYLDQRYTLCVCDLVSKQFSHFPISCEVRELIHNEVKQIWED